MIVNQNAVNATAVASRVSRPAETTPAALSSQVAARYAADYSPETNWLSKAAQNDPADAAKLASGYAYMDDLPLIDISGFPGPAVYVATGQPVTEASERAFHSTAARMKEGRIELYQSEKAKGTPDAEILNKLRAYVDNNAPADFLKLLNWASVSGKTPALCMVA